MLTDEERELRIYRVLELISTGMSYRECASYLSEHEFKISHVTVKDYVDRAKEDRSSIYKKCANVVETNTVKTIKDEEVKQRAKLVFELLKSNYTIEEISKKLKLSYMVVYRDFQRLQTLSEKELNELGITIEDIETVKNNMKERSLDNLKNQKK